MNREQAESVLARRADALRRMGVQPDEDPIAVIESMPKTSALNSGKILECTLQDLWVRLGRKGAPPGTLDALIQETRKMKGDGDSMESHIADYAFSIQKTRNRAAHFNGVVTVDDATTTVCHLAEILEWYFAEFPEGSSPAPRRADNGMMTKVRSLALEMKDITSCALDSRGWLWASNGRKAKVFNAVQEGPVAHRTLPHTRWKCQAPDLWGDRLVLTDWDGSLFALGGVVSSGDRPVYEARVDDTPLHLVDVAPSGELVAAAWNGRIRAWGADGAAVAHDPPIRLACLPTRLLARAGGGLTAVGEDDRLRLFDASGREAWTWQAPGPIRRLLAHQDGDDLVYLAQVGPDRLARVPTNGEGPEFVAFDSPIVDLSRSAVQAGVGWAAVAREGGRIDWVSDRPFQMDHDGIANSDFEVRSIVHLHDPYRAAVRVAIGLTADGRLYTLEEGKLLIQERPRGIEQIILSADSRFLYLRRGDGVVDVYRNPALRSSPLQVDLEGVEGTLVVGEFQPVTIRLRNTASVAIHDVRAQLQASGIIDSNEAQATLAQPLLPGGSVTLTFSVKARVAGNSVPLQMKVELLDEGGPPATVLHLKIVIDAKAHPA